MSTAVRPGSRTAVGGANTTGPQPADAFVVFGITGDLARVMTFHSLYRLERRGLLDCPIVGVAGDDWTVDQLREHARKCIADCGETIDDEVFDRFAARLSYLSGDFGDEATYKQVADAIDGARSPVFYLEIPPSLFGMVIEGLARAGVTQSARVVVEKPFGHDAASAAALNEEVHQHLDESQLYRIDHFMGQDGARRDPLPAVRQHDVRADLESQPRRVGADHDGRELRRGGSRPLLRPGRRAAGRRRQPPHAGGGRRRDGTPGERRRGDAEELDGLGLPGHARRRSRALRAWAVRRLPGDRRRRRGFDDGDLRGSAPRDRQLALVGRALLHPDGKVAPDHADGSCGSSSSTRPGSASSARDLGGRNPISSWSGWTPPPGSGS